MAKYPGPLIAKITDWYSAYHNYIGDVHIDVLRCHEIYGKEECSKSGPVNIQLNQLAGDFVRYGPEKLVVNSVTGFHGKDKPNSDIKLIESWDSNLL